ncbi:hypothetical protein [Thauera sp. 2A1]|uniref:hypothetical protein n=1 Tax=Thauera sp. 2A1 TaxID=2570191 RepID=UPI001291FC19|nr:hypothetical protein [Thauera sp. 2A1]KAI5915342.1 hypothetical protein GH664_07355 [Thauera sp. 2A1]
MSRRLAALLLTLSACCAPLAPAWAGEPASQDAAAPRDADPAAQRPGATEETPAQQAARLKEQGQALRQAAEATYLRTEAGCYRKFLVNDCIDKAKTERLQEIRKAREIEAEARRIEQAERQRAADAAGHGDVTTAPTTPAGPSSTSEATVKPTPEAERIRAQREAGLEKAGSDAAAARAEKDAVRASQRARAEADAAKRARQAEEDRARYEKRMREYEEQQARDAAGKR